MKAKKLFTRTIAFLLMVTMISASSFGTKIAIASTEIITIEYLNEISDFNQLNADSLQSFANAVNMLNYDGEQRIVSNVIYAYSDGRLVSMTDARGNTAYLKYDKDGNLIEIHTDTYVMQVGINEFGFLTHYAIVGTNIGAVYEYTEDGVLVGITRNGIHVELSIDDATGYQSILLNGNLIAENSLNPANSDTAFSTDMSLSSRVGVEMFNEYLITPTLEFDEHYRITNIRYSNNVTLSAERGEFGSSNTNITFINSRGVEHAISTTVEPRMTAVGELARLDAVYFTQNENEFRHVMNDLGFIGYVYRDGILTIQFFYDEITGQLIKEICHVRNTVSTFSYDDFGNILYRTATTPYGTQTFTYEYNNPEWRDQLTAFNGSPIRHDQQGNMTSGLGMELFWENGNLVRIEKGADVVTFTHNSSGVRDSMTVNGVTTYFLLEGNRIIAERSTDGQSIFYMFDDEDSLIGFTLNGVKYFYVTNLQGDVIGILNENMELIVEYAYDIREVFTK